MATTKKQEFDYFKNAGFGNSLTLDEIQDARCACEASIEEVLAETAWLLKSTCNSQLKFDATVEIVGVANRIEKLNKSLKTLTQTHATFIDLENIKISQIQTETDKLVAEVGY